MGSFKTTASINSTKNNKQSLIGGGNITATDSLIGTKKLTGTSKIN